MIKLAIMKWALQVCVSRALSSLWHPDCCHHQKPTEGGREGHSNGQEIAHQQKTAKISGFKLTRRRWLIWIIAILCYLKAATGIFPIIDQKKLPKLLRLSLCLVRELESNERELTRITISIIIHEYIVPGLYLEMKQLFFSNFNWEKTFIKTRVSNVCWEVDKRKLNPSTRQNYHGSGVSFTLFQIWIGHG